VIVVVDVDGDGDGDGDDSPTEPRRHGNDAGDELDPTSMSFLLEYRKNLLHRGASGEWRVPCSIRRASPTCRLGDVQRHRKRGASKLVGKVSEATWKLGGRDKCE